MRKNVVAFGALPGVMAILNVTPDSFSDGGRFASAEAAADEGARLRGAGRRDHRRRRREHAPKGSAYGEGAREIS